MNFVCTCKKLVVHARLVHAESYLSSQTGRRLAEIFCRLAEIFCWGHGACFATLSNNGTLRGSWSHLSEYCCLSSEYCKESYFGNVNDHSSWWCPPETVHCLDPGELPNNFAMFVFTAIAVKVVFDWCPMQ